MRKDFLLLLMLFLPGTMLADKNIRQVWVSMPDSIIPYLNKEYRSELVDFAEKKLQSEVKNNLWEMTRIDTLTDNYLRIKLNDAHTIQMKLLPYNGQQLLCVIKSFKGPSEDSEISFYTTEWKLIDRLEIGKNSEYTDGSCIYNMTNLMMHKNEDMPEEQYQELINKIDLQFIAADILPDKDNIIFRLSLSTLNKEEETEFQKILLPLVLKWNGQTFVYNNQ